MREVLDWVDRLDALVQQRGSGGLVAAHRRVVVPGDIALSGSGLVRFQPLGQVARVGSLPESMSLMGWLDDAAASRSEPVTSVLAQELGAVLTLVMNRRVEVLDEIPLVMEGSNTTTFMPIAGVVDSGLAGPPESVTADRLDADLREVIGRLRGLPGLGATAVSSAIHLHHAACQLVGRDIAAAYALLVAALESLSRVFGSPPTAWSDWNESASWDAFCSEANLGDEQRGALISHLMKEKQLRLSETFATYPPSKLPDSFWDETIVRWEPRIVMPAGTVDGGGWSEPRTMRDLIDPAHLRGALKRAYAARSGFVHQGRRDVSLGTEMVALVRGTPLNRPPPGSRFCGILRRLIYLELNSGAADYVTPDVVFTIEL